MKTSEILSRIVSLESLSKKELERIATTFHPVNYRTGEQLMRQGDIIKVAGLIGSGRILLMLPRPGGEMVQCGTLCSGDFLVDPGLMTSGRSIVSAYAETPVLCHVRALKDYWAMVEAHPQIREFFYKHAMIQLIKALETLNGASRDDPCCQDEDRDSLLFPRAVRKALLYIEKNYMEPLRLEPVAQVNGMSKYHFSRIFKEKTGYTFTAYLNRRRIERAKYFMEHEAKNVSEAAFAVGYNDLAYFSRLFQRQEGLPPSKYRKALVTADRQKHSEIK
jgi:AraC-like DNA-binding protein